MGVKGIESPATEGISSPNDGFRGGERGRIQEKGEFKKRAKNALVSRPRFRYDSPKMKMFRIARSIALVFLALVSGGGLLADTVKLKDGKSFDGKITYEGTDFIKLEMAVSASIKETKTILRTDIAEIVKAAPDDVALDAIRKQLPAPSLLTADGYRALIEKGPKAFLAQFPGSRHKARKPRA